MTTSHQSNLESSDDSFFGTWTAIVTPFTDSGAIDWDTFEALLTRQADAKVTGVVVCGTTGESPTLTHQEKLALFRKARAFLPETVRVMAGTGGNNTATSVELSQLAEDAGADSLLIVTPPYNKPSLAGLKGHYETIAKAVKIPLCLYHVPGRTGQHLSVNELVALTKIEGIACVKEASSDLGFFSRCQTQSSVAFLSGDDPTCMASTAVGGKGVISVVSNVFPAATVRMIDDTLNGRIDEARKIHQILLPAIDALFLESNPAPTKAILQSEGLGSGFLRAPLAPVTPGNREIICAIYDDVKQKLQNLSAT